MVQIQIDHEDRSHKKPNYKVRYVVRRQFIANGTYGDKFGDAGLIIDRLLGGSGDEKLIRLGAIEEYRSKESYECGQCGNKFSTMRFRDEHVKKRHSPRPSRMINLEDMTDEQREAFRSQNVIPRAEWERVDPRDPTYRTEPGEFLTPDPMDAEIAAEEKRENERAPLYMDKTKASRK